MKGVTVKKIKPVHSDERGTITDILNENVKHVGLITTKAGTERANHHHKTSIQYSYILSGKFKVIVAPSEDTTKTEEIILTAGEMITISPGIEHSFKAIVDADMIDIISQSREGHKYEEDVVKGLKLQ